MAKRRTVKFTVQLGPRGIVRTQHEQQLRDAVRQLLADGYDFGQISRISLDAMGVLDLIDPLPPSPPQSRLRDTARAPTSRRRRPTRK
jgi:hypothetical protein